MDLKEIKEGYVGKLLDGKERKNYVVLLLSQKLYFKTFPN